MEHAYERGASLGAKHAQGARYEDSYACGAIEYAHGACGARTVLGMRVQYGACGARFVTGMRSQQAFSE